MTITLQTLPRMTNYGMRLISAANALNPAFGGDRQRLARKGSHFALDVEVPALRQDQCGMALIADLARGEVEPVTLPIPEGRVVESWGTPLVNGAGAAGTSLPVKGVTPGKVVPKGKFISIFMTDTQRRYVHLVTANATPNGSGLVTLNIWPMLRRSPHNEAIVELAQPYIDGFVGPAQEWSISRMRAIGVKFSIEERG